MPEIYLVYTLTGWGVFDLGGCPDLAPFPITWYKRYEVSDAQFDQVFRKLLKIQEKLVKDDIRPTPPNPNIFPRLEELTS